MRRRATAKAPILAKAGIVPVLKTRETASLHCLASTDEELYYGGELSLMHDEFAPQGPTLMMIKFCKLRSLLIDDTKQKNLIHAFLKVAFIVHLQ